MNVEERMLVILLCNCVYVDFPDGVGHRHKTVAKIVVFGRFYSKNKGKSAYTVARKIKP